MWIAWADQNGPTQNSSQLSAPGVRPQARCVFACLPGNTNMHPRMSWAGFNSRGRERLSSLHCLVAKTLLEKFERWVYIAMSLKGELSPHFPGDYYHHFSGSYFLKKSWSRHLLLKTFPHPWPQGKKAPNAGAWEGWSSNTPLDPPEPSCFASKYFSCTLKAPKCLCWVQAT